ncbi:MAG: nucleoid-associated protein, YbaB/EbfC family [Chloroflexi bacterium 44-23]|nr:MAG: nucleoid-associated protein, YbaB/EbfC family [Chloroflexi bacterium 44-23]
MAKGFGRSGAMGGGGGGGQQAMMRQLQKLQEQMEQAQLALAEETITASVGGGVIKVTMTGDQHCRAIELNPELLLEPDLEMLQDLLLSAVNMALDQSRDLANERLGPLSGGLSGLGF